MKNISIIIPMHNSAKHINQCINSILNQTYKNWEIIVIDDASEDESVELVKKYNDNRIKIIELKENVGAGLARNKGIEVANGDYICFLDSDDYWVLDKLEKQIKLMEQNNYTFIYGGYDYLKNGIRKKAKVPSSLNYNQLLKNHSIFTSTVMLNMEHLKKEDIFMPDLRRGQDMATWWKILKKGIVAHGITETLAIYRVGEVSLSSNKLNAIKRTWNLFKNEDLKYFKRLYCFSCYALNAVKRRVG